MSQHTIQQRKLLKAHTHRGQVLKPGDVIALRPDQAAWLDHEGVTGPTPAIETTKKPKE